MSETLLSPSNIHLFGRVVEDLTIDAAQEQDHEPSVPNARVGGNKQLKAMLDTGLSPKMARIYGFSYEGTYYDLPRPVLFLVHGDGELVTERRPGRGAEGEDAAAAAPPQRHPSRAPADPSLSGVAAADFEFADDIKVWSYDKADYTIRMDVQTGMFEQVLLDLFFAEGGAPQVSGAYVSGAYVSGAYLSGRRPPGARGRGRRGEGND